VLVACVVALIVANPMGFVGLLASTGYFIVRTLLGIVEIILAVIYWGIKNVAVAIANAFIAGINLVIAIINGVANSITAWIKNVLPGIPDWNPIPQLNYLIVSPMPETLYTVMAEIGLGWQGVVASWGTYQAGVTPGSLTLGVGAGAASGGIVWRYGPEYREYERRKHRRPPSGSGRKKIKRGAPPPGGSMKRRKRIPPDRRRRRR